MAMHIMRDLSLIDIVGLEEGELPSTDDPVEVFAFVSEFSSKQLREVGKALQKREEPDYKPVLTYKADVYPRKKVKETSPKSEPLKADIHERTTGPSCGVGRLKDLMAIRSSAKNKSLVARDLAGAKKVLRSRRRESEQTDASGLLAGQEAGADAQMHEGGNKRGRPAEARTEKIKKKPKVVPAPLAAAGPNPPLDLPDKFRDMNEGMSGINPVVVIQKSLFNTDLAPQQNRLSIPIRVMKNKFLEEEEEKLLKDRKNDKSCNKIDTTLIDTKGVVWRSVPLRRWEMRKQNGSNSTIMYVLTDPWIKLALNNGLKQNDVVQLWAFRADEKLCFALVKL